MSVTQASISHRGRDTLSRAMHKAYLLAKCVWGKEYTVAYDCKEESFDIVDSFRVADFSDTIVSYCADRHGRVHARYYNE